MRFYHLDDFLLGYLLTELLHGEINVFWCYFSRFVGVELAEDCTELVFGKESSDVNGGREELTVVNFAVAVVVNFSDHVLDV